MLVYLSAVDFKVITEVFNIDFDASIAQGIFQGIMPIGGAVGAVSSAYFIGLFSRRYTCSICLEISYSLLMQLASSFAL
jgi:hypothetical protein